MRKNKETREVEWPSGPSIHRSGSRYPWSIDVVCLLELNWSWLIYFSGVCRLTWTGGGTHWSSTATKIRQRRCQNVRCVSLRPPHHMSCNNTVTLRPKKKKKREKWRKKNVNIRATELVKFVIDGCGFVWVLDWKVVIHALCLIIYHMSLLWVGEESIRKSKGNGSHGNKIRNQNGEREVKAVWWMDLTNR